MSKKSRRMKVGVRSTHQTNRIDALRYGYNGYGPSKQDAPYMSDHLPVDVFMREMSKRFGRL
jgi:hypothetical protein